MWSITALINIDQLKTAKAQGWAMSDSNKINKKAAKLWSYLEVCTGGHHLAQFEYHLNSTRLGNHAEYCEFPDLAWFSLLFMICSKKLLWNLNWPISWGLALNQNPQTSAIQIPLVKSSPSNVHILSLDCLAKIHYGASV